MDLELSALDDLRCLFGGSRDGDDLNVVATDAPLAVYVSPQGLRRLTPPMPAVCRKRLRFASVRSCIRFSCRDSLAAAFGCNERLLLVERERVSADTGIEELNLESQIRWPLPPRPEKS